MSKQITPNVHNKLIIIGAVIVAIILFDLSPFGGNIRFYAKWISCGQKPVQIESWGGNKWYEESPAFMPLMRNQSWYCTPIQAERAGYSADEHAYSFPHLKAAGEPDPFLKRFLESHPGQK